MKHFLMAILAIGLCLAPNFVHSQNRSTSITGKILDETKLPVAAATITLIRKTDSLILKYELSDPQGSFGFQGIAKGRYYLNISAIGKLAYHSGDLQIDSGQLIIRIPDIIMLSKSTSLSEVSVTAKKRLIEYKIDRTVINVDELISNAGSTALEVLEKSPGVSIAQGGTISFHGKSGVAIYVDDKPTYLSGADLESYLRSMSSSGLAQIELMTNPPARYEAAGTAGIINIKTKRNNVTGFNMGLNISLRQGRYITGNNSADFNYRKNKFNVYGSVAYMQNNSFNDVDISRNYFYNNGLPSGAFNQHSFISTKSKNLNARLGIDIYASEKTTIGMLLTGIKRTPDNDNQSNGILSNSIGKPDSAINSLNNEKGRFENGGASISYKHVFQKDGPEITGSLDYLGFHTGNNQLFQNQNYSYGATPASTEQLKGELLAAIKIYSAKLDYSQLIRNGWKLEAGAKSSYTNTDNGAQYFNTSAGVTLPDYNKTNHFLYQEAINAGYIDFKKDYRRLSIQGGLRLENSDSRGHQLGNLLKSDSAFNRTYTSLFPTLYFLYKLDSLGDHQLKMNYGRRIERPYYQDLNPFVSPLDKYTFYIGNPYLLPSYSGNYELGYVYKDRISVTLNYMNISDRVAETIEIRNGIYYDRPGNIGSTRIYDLNFDADFEPITWLSVQFGGDVWQIFQKSDFYTGVLNTHATSFQGQGLLQFKLRNAWTLQAEGKYQGKQTDGQFVMAARGRINAGISKSISRMVIKLSVNDLFNTNIYKGAINNLYYTSASFKTIKDSRAVLLSMSMRFGKTIAGQREHVESAAAEENDRVKN